MRYAFDSSTIWLVVCRLFVIGGDLGLPRNIRSWIALTEFVKGSIIIDTWFCGIYRYHGLFCGPIWISIGYESAQQLTASMPASPRVLAVNRYRYGPINLCAHLLQFPNALQFLRATVIWQCSLTCCQEVGSFHQSLASWNAVPEICVRLLY